jgi:hypothetical protein
LCESSITSTPLGCAPSARAPAGMMFRRKASGAQPRRRPSTCSSEPPVPVRRHLQDGAHRCLGRGGCDAQGPACHPGLSDEACGCPGSHWERAEQTPSRFVRSPVCAHARRASTSAWPLPRREGAQAPPQSPASSSVANPLLAAPDREEAPRPRLPDHSTTGSPNSLDSWLLKAAGRVAVCARCPAQDAVTNRRGVASPSPCPRLPKTSGCGRAPWPSRRPARARSMRRLGRIRRAYAPVMWS